MKTALIRSAAMSDPGNVRGNNEDRVYADDERGIYLVIDGVGGEAAGERAAAIAEEEVVARLGRTTGAIEDRLREGIALASKRILEQARHDPRLAGMSCVLTAALVADGEVIVGHVGDTRLYKLRGGVIRKITRDHSPVGAREDAGEISEREAMQHPRRNEIFRDVGSEEHAPWDPEFVDIQRVGFEPDAALLLCSDGLTDQVASPEIAQIVAERAGDPWRVARELVRRANEAGGKDNVSVVYVEGPGVVHKAPRAEPEKPGRRLPVLIALLAGIALGAAGVLAINGLWAVDEPPAARTLVAGGEFATIGAALAEARAGDTVEVRPGIYREQLEMKEGVRVVAAPAGQAVLEPRPGAAQPGAAVVFRDLRSGWISGVRIATAGNSGISAGILIDGSDVEVTGVEVEGAASGAIVVRGRSRARVLHNHLHDNSGAGVRVEGEAAPTLVANLIEANGVGVEIARDAQPSARYNAIANNKRAIVWENSPEREAELLKRNFVFPRPRARGVRSAMWSGPPACYGGILAAVGLHTRPAAGMPPLQAGGPLHEPGRRFSHATQGAR
jgi:serine/threonine protein phosphatase PrpC